MVSKKTLLKYRLPLFSLLFWFLCCALYLYFTPPTFTASTILTLKSNQQKLNRNDSQSSSVADQKPQINKVLSRANIQQAIVDLHYQSRIFQSGKFSSKELTSSSPIKINIIKNAARDKKFSVEILNNKQFRLTDRNSNTLYYFNQLLLNSETAFKVLPNLRNLKKAKLDFTIYTLQGLTDEYSDNLQAKTIAEDSSKVKVSFSYADSLKAKGFLSQLIRIYMADRLMRAKTIRLIDMQLDSIKNDLANLKIDIDKLKHTAGQEKLGSNQDAAIEKQINILNRLEHYINTPIDQFSFIPNTFALNDDTLRLLIEKLNNSQIEKQEYLRTEKNGSPLIQQANLKIQNLKTETIQQLEKQNKRLTTKIQAAYEKTPNSSNNTSSSYRALLNKMHNQQQAKVKLYLGLLQKREDLKTIMARPVNFNAQISTTPDHRALPAFIIALSLGLLFPPSFKFFTRDTTFISTGAYFEKLTNKQITATLDYYNRNAKILLPFDHESIFGRQLYQACDSLIELKQKKGRKLIYVNSINAGEGKTFVSNNLSFALACSNQKTLLITSNPDVDLFYYQLKGDDREDLSNYLINDSVEISSIIRTTIEPNLSIIKVGQEVDKAFLTANKKRMDSMLSILRLQYDFILVDIASISPQSWFATEIVLTILRHKQTTYTDLKSYVQLSKISSEHQLFILNGMPPKLN
jgi:tyrosine-protein kinase Etk/Wzc